MSEPTSGIWYQAGCFNIYDYVESIWHAGISIDGKHCLAADAFDVYLVWDIDAHEVIWQDDSGSEYPALKDWIKESFVEINDGPAKGKYRIFGLDFNYAVTEDAQAGIKLAVNRANGELKIIDLSAYREIQRLRYYAFSNDWTFASFSEDYSTIAVLEPYNITFFRQGERVESEGVVPLP